MGSNGVAYSAEVASATKAGLECWSNGKDVALKTDIDLSYNTPSLHYSSAPCDLFKIKYLFEPF
jgi:hypothetical protein